MRHVPAPAQTSPLYVRLKRAIRDEIGTKMHPGGATASGHELIREYAVSRNRVRLVGALANEGLQALHQGRGSFVAETKSTVPHAFGLVRVGGYWPSCSSAATLISHDVIGADTHTSGALQMELATDVHRIRWTESSEVVPPSYRVSYLPSASFPGLDTKQSSIDGLRTALARFAGNTFVREETFEVVLADPFRATLLDVAEGSPLLLVKALIHGEDGAPLEMTRAFYGGHSTRLKLSHLTADTEPAV